MYPIPCPFSSGSGPTFVLHALVNISSTSEQETITTIVSGLCSCYISPNPLSRECLHLFAHSHLFSELHDLTLPLMAPPNCPLTAVLVCRTFLISFYGSRLPSWRSTAQLGKASSTAVTCTLMTWQGARYTNSTCLLHCLLRKTVHQKNVLSVLYVLLRKSQSRVIDAAADVFFRCDDVLVAYSGPTLHTLTRSHSPHTAFPLSFIVCTVKLACTLVQLI